MLSMPVFPAKEREKKVDSFNRVPMKVILFKSNLCAGVATHFLSKHISVSLALEFFDMARELKPQ